MKRMGMLITMVCICNLVMAQNFQEWFRQRKTQIKYLVNQIAALQVYIEFAQKGYEIADKGLTLIGDIKKSDFTLHEDFFSALKSVNPSIRNNSNIARIIQLQLKIVESYNHAIQKIRQSSYITQTEKEYLLGVYGRVLNSSMENIKELGEILTSNQYELSDEERIKRINVLYKDMEGENEFMKWFTGQTDVLIVNRKKETKDVDVLNSLMQEK